MSKFKIFILLVFILGYAAFGESYRKADVTKINKIEREKIYEFYGYRHLPPAADSDKNAIVALEFDKEPFIYAYTGATDFLQDPPQPAAKIALVVGDECERDSVGVADIFALYTTCGDRTPPDDLKKKIWVAHNPANGQMCPGSRGAAEVYNIIYRCVRDALHPPPSGGDGHGPDKLGDGGRNRPPSGGGRPLKP